LRGKLENLRIVNDHITFSNETLALLWQYKLFLCNLMALDMTVSSLTVGAIDRILASNIVLNVYIGGNYINKTI